MPDSDAETFLKALIAADERSGRQLCADAGVSSYYIGNWKRRPQYGPTLRNAEKLARALGYRIVLVPIASEAPRRLTASPAPKARHG